MELKNLSSNWKKLQATLKAEPKRSPKASLSLPHGVKRKRDELQQFSRDPKRSYQKMNQKPSCQHQKAPENGTNRAENRPETADQPLCVTEKINSGTIASTEIGKYVAIDCEMVGVGTNPDKDSALARVSVVNYNGEQVYDSYVLTKEPVTDWRTHISGILPKHMLKARTLEEVQLDITKILQDRVLVGHAIRNDLNALLLGHPKRDIRDTARHAPYRKLAGGGSPRLKILAKELLGLDIQAGEHSSVEDARACMMLFRRDKDAFEREHAKKWPPRVVEVREDGEGTSTKPKKKKKKKKKK